MGTMDMMGVTGARQVTAYGRSRTRPALKIFG